MPRFTRAVAASLTFTALAAAPAVAAGPSGSSSGPAPIPWTRCAGVPAADPVRCGTVREPVDHAHPSGAAVAIRVARVPAADPAHRIGTLFFNFGGPGVGAVGYLLSAQVRETYFPRALRERFDLVAVEPRGTGGNDPLNCPPPVDHAVTRFPRDAGQVRALVASNHRLGAACRAAAGPVGGYLDTRSVARDLDDVRVRLGERRVSFLGLSYGTMLAQAYAELFPRRLRSLVLDGVVDRSRSWRRLAEDDAAAVDDGVGRFARWCRTTGSCAVRDAGVRATIAAALRRADAGRVRDGSRPVRAEEIAQAVNNGLNEPGLYATIARGLRRAATGGSFAGLAPFGAAADGDYGLYRSIVCQDVPVPARAATAFPAAAREASRRGPTLRGYSEFWDIASGCAGWGAPIRWRPHGWTVPAAQSERIAPLLLSGAHDVATPPVWAAHVHRRLPGSTLVRWDGDGHTAWLGGHSPAAVDRAVAYLTR